MSAVQFASGLLTPRQAATLEVRGRRSGRVISFPVVVADHEGERYVVSMLGESTSWVRNLRADNRGVLRRRRAEPVRLEEVPPERRAPILRRYLELAPGARAHLPVDRRAPLTEFERIADRFPVFRVRSVRAPGAGRPGVLPAAGQARVMPSASPRQPQG
ncbi:nitroreductase/quinone reductase family protein [Georgenia daeguensis]|uniref:nitroreductase/quinone reductase family protein n=1 Tax=Georgenia daeguensis TaxID=908355 RepID=UPI0031F01CED